MAQQNSNTEKHPAASKALSPAQAAHEDQDAPVSVCEKPGKRTLRFAEDEREELHDSPRFTETEESVDKELKSSEEEPRPASSRNISYPLNNGEVGDSRPGSSSAVTWNVSSSTSTQGPPPVGNSPYSTNQTPGLYAPATNFSQTYSTYQPTSLDLYDSPSLASSYSKVSVGHMIPKSEYYTPEVATPSALHVSVRPSEALNQHSVAFGDGKSTQTISQQSMPHPQEQFSSSPAQTSSEQQTTQSRPQQSALPEAGIPFYPPPAPPIESTASQSSAAQLTLPSDTLYSVGAYSKDNDSFALGLYGGSQELQYASCENPRPPGYPSGPNTSKPKMKPPKSQVLRPDTRLSSAQGSTNTPYPSSPGLGTYVPYKESVYDGAPFGSRVQPVSEPAKYMSPTTSMSKRPLAFVPPSAVTTSKPLAYVRPPNSSMSDSTSTPLQSSGQDTRPSLPSYLLHQTPTYAYQQEGSTTSGDLGQKLFRIQGHVEASNPYAVPQAPLLSSEQYTSESDYLLGHTPSEPPHLRPEPLSSSLPIPAGYIQAQQLASNGFEGPLTQETKPSSFDLRFSGRPSQPHSSQVVQTPHAGSRINGDQITAIARPSLKPTYSPGPQLSLDTRISPPSSYISNSSTLLSSPGPAAFQNIGIPQHKIPDVHQISPNVRLEQKQSYGQQPMYYGSQNSPYLAKHNGSQGQVSLGQSSGEAFIPGYQTPKLRPQQQTQVPYELKPPQSGVPAYDQNPGLGHAVGHAANVAVTTSNGGEQSTSSQYTKNTTAPSNYDGSLPQQPYLCSGSNGFPPPSSRPGYLPANNQLPNPGVSPHLGPSNYGKANDSNPSIMVPGTPSVSQQATQNPYRVGNPNIPFQQGAGEFTLPNHYGRPPTSGTVTGAQHPQHSFGGQHINPDQHFAHVQSTLNHAPGSQPQVGRLSYPSSGPGNYANPTTIPNIVTPSGNLSQSRISPNNQGISPLPQPYGGFNTPQSYVAPGAGVPPRSSMGLDGRPHGPVGGTQSSDVYEQYLRVLNDMGTLGINNAGRM